MISDHIHDSEVSQEEAKGDYWDPPTHHGVGLKFPEKESAEVWKFRRVVFSEHRYFVTCTEETSEFDSISSHLPPRVCSWVPGYPGTRVPRVPYPGYYYY
eukprot:3914733-Rhodomonas_salina.1